MGAFRGRAIPTKWQPVLATFFSSVLTLAAQLAFEVRATARSNLRDPARRAIACMSPLPFLRSLKPARPGCMPMPSSKLSQLFAHHLQRLLTSFAVRVP